MLSVRQLKGDGLTGLFSKPRLEVVAQVAGAPEESEAQRPATSGLVSAEPAAPANFAGLYSGAPVQAEQMTGGSKFPPAAAPRDVLPKLPELLRRSGFSESMLTRLHGSGVFSLTEEPRPLHRQLVEVGEQLRKHAATKRPRPLPARSAFIGPAGVGRTTALCKWLAKEVFARQRVGRVIKAEFDRPNPAEGLAVFCEALGLNLEYYAPDDPEAPSTVGGPVGEFLYADLPGISLRSGGENAQIAGFLDREKFAGRVLVLNAAYDISTLRRAYAVGSDLGATHVVFTHLDEFDHWGKLWDLVLDGDLSPLFLATGPSLTGDCEEDAVTSLLRKTIPGSA